MPETGGAALLRADMVENEEAASLRELKEVEDAVRRAIGLSALQEMADD